MDVTFCFLVTKDLVKEHIWRKWFDRLCELNFKFQVITHVSPNHKENVKSDWLQKTILPDDYLCETAWGYLMKAMLQTYSYATTHSPAAWYTFHSETCVPFVTPEKFVDNFHAFKTKSFLSYCKIWWDPLSHQRANLHLLPSDYHYAHQQWSILCHEDLIQMVSLAQTDLQLTYILSNGSCADESWIAIFLYKINNFKNVITKRTTLVDWKRSIGPNPYTFVDWLESDKITVDELQLDNNILFMRKVGSTFPDIVLNEIMGFNE